MEDHINEHISFSDIVAGCREMQQLIKNARELAKSDSAVLLRGDSGTGKELLARAMHEASPRKNGPFVVVNCEALPDVLVVSDLFGHIKEGPEDTERDKTGKFQMAAGGTLFIDEVGALSAVTQVKILKVLEEKSFRPNGANEDVTLDCRLIAATKRDLLKNISSGEFREDLYFILREGILNIPPLKKRKEEIPLLVNHFIDEFNRKLHKSVKEVSDVTMNYLNQYDWPGNVRELKSIIKIGMALVDRETVWLEDLPFKVELMSGGTMGAETSEFSLDTMEKEHIRKVLVHTYWNKFAAAKLLKISRPTLDRKIKKYGLSKRSINL